ncbi:hypothetical protein AHAS_Ahas18G0160000 [Arachis hypogaea]
MIIVGVAFTFAADGDSPPLKTTQNGHHQVRSVTLVDPVSSTSGALPICVLEYPVGRDGEKAVVAIGNKLNYSFDIAELGGSENLKAVPMQVLWSSGWSKEWSDEGNRVARALPWANFVTHSGGRWPQVSTK